MEGGLIGGKKLFLRRAPRVDFYEALSMKSTFDAELEGTMSIEGEGLELLHSSRRIRLVQGFDILCNLRRNSPIFINST